MQWYYTINLPVFSTKPPYKKNTLYPYFIAFFFLLNFFFKKLFSEIGAIFKQKFSDKETMVTKEVEIEGDSKNKTEIILKEDRPAIIMSSTSWTKDEDFSIFLDAIKEIDNSINNNQEYPKIVFIITGKGPEKQYYEKLISTSNFHKVSIHTMFLSHTNYALLLGSSDIGVSLHTSSSGLDLPMKVVDMFGCQLPVCAYNFNCLSELVQHKSNGMVFNSSHQLATQILVSFLQISFFFFF